MIGGVTDEIGKLFGTASGIVEGAQSAVTGAQSTVAQLQTQAQQLETAVKTQLALSAVTAIGTSVLVAIALAKARSAQPVRVTVRHSGKRRSTRKGR